MFHETTKKQKANIRGDSGLGVFKGFMVPNKRRTKKCDLISWLGYMFLVSHLFYIANLNKDK